MALRELPGIELPTIQAPMAGAQGSAPEITVSNAGGLGSLPWHFARRVCRSEPPICSVLKLR